MTGLVLSAPINGATYTYAYRDTAGTWSSEIAMDAGVVEREVNFISPVCDELRITMTCPSSVLDKVHIEGLNLTGLSFDIDDGAVTNFAQTVDPQPKDAHRQKFQLTGSTVTTVTLTITGIAQQELNIDQLAFCYEAWGEHCYQGLDDSLMNQYLTHDTYGYSGRSLRSRKEFKNLVFQDMEYSEYEDLKYLADYTLVDRFCLAEFVHTDDSHFVRIDPSSASWQSYIYYSFNIGLTEVYAQ